MNPVKATKITESGGLDRLESAGGEAFDHPNGTATDGARPLSGGRPAHGEEAARLTVGAMPLAPKSG